MADESFTMQDMAKRKTPQQPASEPKPAKPANRSPAWAIYARLDPDLESPTQAYIDAQEYPPALARVLERALKDLLKEHGFWPPKDRAD